MTSSSTLTAARGTLLAIALRLLSFLLSQLTVRFVSVAALGKASIPLELLLSSTLFVAREGFRLALTKEIGGCTDDDNNNDDYIQDEDEKNRESRNIRVQQLVNVSWLSVPTGALLSTFALLVHLHKCNNNDDINDDVEYDEYAILDYKLAGILYCFASFIESLAEPLVIRCLQQMDVTTKAKAEGAALVMKSISCFGCLYLTRFSRWFSNIIMIIISRSSAENGIIADATTTNTNSFAVTAFGISQLVYALVFTTIMYQKAKSSKLGGIHWPKYINTTMTNPYRKKNVKNTLQTNSSNFDVRTLYLVCIFTLQGLFKHALTEADKIVLSALAGAYDQGVYALAASYGGLAARMLLQPMEENARLLFSRQGALVAQHTTSNRDEKGSKSTAFNLLKELEETYFFLIRIVLYIGLLFATIATNYTSILLRVLAGSRWGTNVEASSALSAFCVYTAFLALNGLTEAFVYGVARSGNDVGKIGIAHAVVGGLFALIAPGLVRTHGAVGLVAANCISMALRAMYSLHYARGYFANAWNRRISIMSLVSCMLPNFMAMAAFGISFAITRTSRIYIYDAQITEGKSWMVAGSQHILVGVSCVILTAMISLWVEKDIRNSIVKLLKLKRKTE